MLIRRRSLLAAALAPVLPMEMEADAALVGLGADLDRLRAEAAALEVHRFDPAGWARWNQTMETSLALAKRIARLPANDLAGFSVRLRAFLWDAADDLEEHQVAYLESLAKELRLAHDRSE